MRAIKGLLPTILVGVMGNSVIYLIPLLVGGMVTDRGFTEQQAGLLASIDLGGYALATALTAYLVDSLMWERVLVSKDGPDNNVIKIKPPLVITRASVDVFVDALDRVLTTGF